MKKQSLFAKNFFVTHSTFHAVPKYRVIVTIDFFHTDWIEAVELSYIEAVELSYNDAVELSYNDDVRILWEDVPKYMRRYIDNI